MPAPGRVVLGKSASRSGPVSTPDSARPDILRLRCLEPRLPGGPWGQQGGIQEPCLLPSSTRGGMDPALCPGPWVRDGAPQLCPTVRSLPLVLWWPKWP